MLQAPFMMLGMIIMMGQRAAASAERIYEILDEQPTVADRPGAVDLVECKGDVRFDHVDFSYGADADRLVLADFDLHLAPGETVALVGRTGSGKSTVARLLTRFYDVTAGSVRIDDHDVRDLTLASLRANVGIVLDEPFLFSVSVRDNIAYGRARRRPMDDVEAAARAAGAHEFITPARARVRHRGRRARLHAVGRPAPAHRHRPHPAGQPADPGPRRRHQRHRRPGRAADPPSLRVLMEGRTTLIVAHRLSTIRLADRVVLLDGQRIVADGTHAELLAIHPALRRGAGPGGRTRGGRSPARTAATAVAGPDLAELVGTGGAADDLGRWRDAVAAAAASAAPGRSAARRPPACPSPASPPSSRPGWTGSWPRSPSTAPPTVTFDQNSSEDELRRLTLWRLLTKYPRMLVWAGLLVVVIAVVGQAGPELTGIAINHGIAAQGLRRGGRHGRPLPGEHRRSPPWPSGPRCRSPGGWPPG